MTIPPDITAADVAALLDDDGPPPRTWPPALVAALVADPRSSHGYGLAADPIGPDR